MRDTEERLRQRWDKFSGRYDKSMGFWERRLFAGGREWVCAQARGDVLEIAVGTGRNLPHYPVDVRLTGIEYSPGMLAIARQRAEELGRPADLRPGDAQALEFADASFDTVVCTFALCTIPDDRRAVLEASRVLRPGGTFLAIEHVRSPSRVVGAAQAAIEPLWRLIPPGDHLTREPVAHLEPAGLRVERLERLKWGIVERVRAIKIA